MIAPNLISDLIPPLHIEDSGERALMMMQEYDANQFPVVDGTKYAGLITMEEIINLKHLSHSLNSFQLPAHKPFVLDTGHIYDVMKAAVDFNVKVVPVVNEQHTYLGLISTESCLRSFASLNSVKDPGAIIELEASVADYSLSELAGIADENETKILSFYTHLNHKDGLVEITLKLDSTDITALIASFERFEYVVKAVYNDKEYSEELKERYDALMRYLKV